MAVRLTFPRAETCKRMQILSAASNKPKCKVDKNVDSGNSLMNKRSRTKGAETMRFPSHVAGRGHVTQVRQCKSPEKNSRKSEL